MYVPAVITRDRQELIIDSSIEQGSLGVATVSDPVISVSATLLYSLRRSTSREHEFIRCRLCDAVPGEHAVPLVRNIARDGLGAYGIIHFTDHPSGL